MTFSHLLGITQVEHYINDIKAFTCLTDAHLGASNRYIPGESLVQQSVLLGQVKLKEQSEHQRGHYGIAGAGSSFIPTPCGDHNLLQDVDRAFGTPDQYAMAIRRRGSNLLNLTVASEAELRRATGGHHGVPKHELRSAVVYLTLTNN